MTGPHPAFSLFPFLAWLMERVLHVHIFSELVNLARCLIQSRVHNRLDTSTEETEECR